MSPNSSQSKLTFGDAQDLQIYKGASGSNSFIHNASGNLNITQNSGKIRIDKNTGDEMAHFNVDGSVELFHNSVKKFETEAYGIDVTGTTQSDTLIVTGVSTVASLIFSAGTNTNGIAYFDSNGQVQSTVSPASGISTSNSILTTNASGVPTWTDTIDCGTF